METGCFKKAARQRVSEALWSCFGASSPARPILHMQEKSHETSCNKHLIEAGLIQSRYTCNSHVPWACLVCCFCRRGGMSSGVDGVQHVLLPGILPVDLDKAREV